MIRVGRPSSDRGGTFRLSEALSQYLTESGLAARMRHGPVFEAWSRALGPELARRARPVRFGRGELTVEVESSAHLNELRSFTGERYRGLANRELGSETIRRVAFKLKK